MDDLLVPSRAMAPPSQHFLHSHGSATQHTAMPVHRRYESSPDVRMGHVQATAGTSYGMPSWTPPSYLMPAFAHTHSLGAEFSPKVVGPALVQPPVGKPPPPMRANTLPNLAIDTLMQNKPDALPADRNFSLAPLTAPAATYFDYSFGMGAVRSTDPPKSPPKHSRDSPYTRKAPTDDKPHQCDECSHSFMRPHDLKRHKRIHMTIKPFPCGWCDKSFARKDALKRHFLVKGCGIGRGQTQADSEAGISRAPSLQVGADGEVGLLADTPASFSPRSVDDDGNSSVDAASLPTSPELSHPTFHRQRLHTGEPSHFSGAEFTILPKPAASQHQIKTPAASPLLAQSAEAHVSRHCGPPQSLTQHNRKQNAPAFLAMPSPRPMLQLMQPRPGLRATTVDQAMERMDQLEEASQAMYSSSSTSTTNGGPPALVHYDSHGSSDSSYAESPRSWLAGLTTEGSNTPSTDVSEIKTPAAFYGAVSVGQYALGFQYPPSSAGSVFGYSPSGSPWDVYKEA